MEYLVVVEKGKSSYGAYVPDLPGCVAAGETRREVLKLIREAIKLHIEALRESGQPKGTRRLTTRWSARVRNRLPRQSCRLRGAQSNRWADLLQHSLQEPGG